MRRWLVAAVVVLCSTPNVPLLACGDKFFQIGRGERFSRAYRSVHPGELVIYTGGSPKGKGLADPRLQKHFTKAGHRVTLVNTAASLSTVLQSRAVDVIITDDSGSAAIATTPTAATSQPAVLVIKESDKIGGALSKIEDVMSDRTGKVARPRL